MKLISCFFAILQTCLKIIQYTKAITQLLSLDMTVQFLVLLTWL